MIESIMAQVENAAGFPDVVVARRGPALCLQLARPEKSNAYTQPMLRAIAHHLVTADGDPDVRAIVFTGAGDRSFCAGADRDELATRDWQSALTLLAADVFARIESCRCVTIAAINGAAVGGGLELALACDLRLTVPSAKFWLPEPELGLIPAAGGTVRLPRIVGLAKAKELILGGAVWDAAEAVRNGLVTEVVPANELHSRVDIWCERIARRDPLALQLAKQALVIGSRSADSGFDRLAQALLIQRQRNGDQESP